MSLSARRGTVALPSSRRTLKQDGAREFGKGPGGPLPSPGLCQWVSALTQPPGGTHGVREAWEREGKTIANYGTSLTEASTVLGR